MNPAIWTILIALAIAIPAGRYLTSRRYANGNPALSDGQRATMWAIYGVGAAIQGAAYHVGAHLVEMGVVIGFIGDVGLGLALGVLCEIVNGECAKKETGDTGGDDTEKTTWR